MNAAEDARNGRRERLSVGEPGFEGLATTLAESHLLAAHELPDLVRRRAAAFGAVDAMCYLADLQQTTLVPFLGPQGPNPGEQFEPLLIDATLAGRAFQLVETLTQRRHDETTTIWLPLLDGTERLGVLAVTVESQADDPLSEIQGERLRHFASLVAELLTSKTQYGDTIVCLRRRAPMGLAAELQWSLLPPLTFASRDVIVAGALEPAYEVAGDTIDYSVDAGIARLAVFDGMGHGLTSAQLAVLSVAGYRHARRAGKSLRDTCQEIDETLLGSFVGATFTTAVLAELDTQLGILHWVNAGHPEPLLLRSGRLVKTLHSRPRPPLGLDLRSLAVSREPTIASEQLEPGDLLLFYTDGVTEARAPDGTFFGEQRLADLIVRNLAAGLPAPETVRRVVHALLEHQQGRLDDDASLLMVAWHADPHSETL
jgi:serine phosphatase RsbU (regulator of sigma subunit)